MSLVAQGLRVNLPVQGVWVLSLVGELRSHVPHGVAKNKNNKKQRESNQDKLGVFYKFISEATMYHHSA